jgi:hypothetical protein
VKILPSGLVYQTNRVRYTAGFRAGLLAATVLSLTLSTSCPGADPSEIAERSALIIGLEQSGTGRSLPTTEADVLNLANTLSLRCGFRVQEEANITGDQMKNSAKRWANQCANGTTHGIMAYRGIMIIAPDGTAFLAGTDWKSPGDLRGLTALTSLLEPLRKMSEQATVTVLLDVETDSQPAEIDAALQRSFAAANLSNTNARLLAGCAKPGQSQWSEKKLSRFGYWVCEGLRSGASQDPETVERSQISFANLSDYVKEKVTSHAKIVALNSPATASDVAVTPTRARKLEEILDDLAENMATQVQENNGRVLVVPDFSIRARVHSEGVPGEDYGPLLKFVMADFKKKLSAKSFGSFDILNHAALRDLLNGNSIQRSDLKTKKMQDLESAVKATLTKSQRPDEVVFVTGEIIHDSGSEITISCVPWRSTPATLFSVMRASALMNSSEWGMIGLSGINSEAIAEYLPTAPNVPAALPAATKRPDASKSNTDKSKARFPTRPQELLDYSSDADIAANAKEIQTLEESAMLAHPMTNPATFPYEVALRINGVLQSPTFSKDKRFAYVRAKKGDTYAVQLINKSPRPVFVRLLVDGLNTLPDYPVMSRKSSDLFEPRAADRRSPLTPAQYVSLANAQTWHCGVGKDHQPAVYEVRGFFTKIDNGSASLSVDAELAKFIVTDADASEAIRKGFPKDVGVITAAFYSSVASPQNMASKSDLGTKMGELTREKVDPYRGQEVPGALLGVVHLRYGIPQAD